MGWLEGIVLYFARIDCKQQTYQSLAVDWKVVRSQSVGVLILTCQGFNTIHDSSLMMPAKGRGE